MKIITRGVISWDTLQVEHEAEEFFNYEGPVAHFGSLSYAVGGGLAGAGQGLANVGAEEMKAQHDEGILRLQNFYAEQRQQNQIGAEQGMQTQRLGQEKELTEEKMTRGSAALQATLAQKKEEAAAERTSREKIASGQQAALVTASRGRGVEAAEIRGPGGAGGAPRYLFKPGKPINQDGPRDPKTGLTTKTSLDTYIGPGGIELVEVPGTRNPNDPGATKFAMRSPNGGLPTNTYNRGIPKELIQDTLGDPKKTIDFHNSFNYLRLDQMTAPIGSPAQRQQQPQPGAHPNTPPLPAGASYGEPPTAGNIGPDNAVRSARLWRRCHSRSRIKAPMR